MGLSGWKNTEHEDGTCAMSLWGAHSERSVARTVLLDNRSQVPDNSIFYTATTTDAFRVLGPASALTINDRLVESKPHPVSTLTGRLGSRNYF